MNSQRRSSGRRAALPLPYGDCGESTTITRWRISATSGCSIYEWSHHRAPTSPAHRSIDTRWTARLSRARIETFPFLEPIQNEYSQLLRGGGGTRTARTAVFGATNQSRVGCISRLCEELGEKSGCRRRSVPG